MILHWKWTPLGSPKHRINCAIVTATSETRHFASFSCATSIQFAWGVSP